MVKAAERLGPEMLTVCVDFDERVMRMGYGVIDAVKRLREAGVTVNHAPGLRSKGVKSALSFYRSIRLTYIT